MQFTLKQLTYFVAAGEAGSILRAAENIHVSQPSISNAIAHLEDVFQVQLFIRHHAQGMSLTTAGSEDDGKGTGIVARRRGITQLCRQIVGADFRVDQCRLLYTTGAHRHP